MATTHKVGEFKVQTFYGGEKRGKVVKIVDHHSEKYRCHHVTLTLDEFQQIADILDIPPKEEPAGQCVDALMDFKTGRCEVEGSEFEVCPQDSEKCAMWKG